MTEETDTEEGKANEPPKEPEKAPETEGPINVKTEAQFNELAEKMGFVKAERIGEMKKELEEVEKRVDGKITDFKKFLDETATHGETRAGRAVTKTKEELEKEEANKLLEGTGMSVD